jgi:hypothetical protein
MFIVVCIVFVYRYRCLLLVSGIDYTAYLNLALSSTKKGFWLADLIAADEPVAGT